MSVSLRAPENTRNATDGVTDTIIAETLIAVCDEMFAVTQRASQSVIIYEVLDFAVGITDTSARLVAQGNGVTMFLGTLSAAVRQALAKFGAGGINRGDVIVTNDPYEGGGTHLSDVTVLMPVFAGTELVAFVCNKAHWSEVGGRYHGSMAVDAAEIFEEGLQLPCVKAFTANGANGALLDVVAANSRLPSMTLGDLYAQVASVRLAERRIIDLCSKYGIAAVEQSMDHTVRRSAERARARLKELPRGTYEAEDWIDADEQGLGPYPVRVKVTIDDEGVNCDFTGSSPQSPTSVNCSAVSLISAARIYYRAVTDPHAPVNDGSFEGLNIVCPPGTVFTCERPAPTSLYWEAVLHVTDLLWKATAEAIPERTTAGHFLSSCCVLVSTRDPSTGDLVVLFEPLPGGWGAGHGMDGERGLVNIIDGDCRTIPIEVTEQRYPVIVERYALRTTSAGAGQWRGGEGIVRRYRLTAASGTLTSIIGRQQFAPWGASGGCDGESNQLSVRRATDGTAHQHWWSTQPLLESDVVEITTGSGGGWGNPLDRDPAQVAEDVRHGLVSVADADAIYGVAVDPVTHDVCGLSDRRQARSFRDPGADSA